MSLILVAPKIVGWSPSNEVPVFGIFVQSVVSLNALSIYPCIYVDVRVGSVRHGVEEEGEQVEEQSEEVEEVVRTKPAWDRQREAAKLLDLESPVDTRRCVCVCVCVRVCAHVCISQSTYDIGVGKFNCML